MIIKIVGFKVGRAKSTCHYKIDVKEYPKGFAYCADIWEAEKKLGHYMRLALEKSDFVSVIK